MAHDFLTESSEEVVGGSQTDVGDFRLARGWVESEAKQSVIVSDANNTE